MEKTTPYKLYMCIDSEPLHRVVNLIVDESDLPKKITDTITTSKRVINFDVETFDEVLKNYKVLLDYLTSTDWYFDDSKVGFCHIGCTMWDEDFQEYTDYHDEDGLEFDEIVDEWIERQEETEVLKRLPV